jgi:peptidoglycan lytic transglycosylase G
MECEESGRGTEVKSLAKYAFLPVLLLALAGGTAAYAWYCIEKPYQGFGSEGVFVTVPKGASQRGVSHILAKEGVIRSAWAFEIYARRHPKPPLQAGEYFFDRPASGKDVFWTIADGKIFEKAFTVREGETMFDIARELETDKFMTADEFLQSASNADLIKDIAPEAKTLEGFLYPATYHLPRHPAPNELTAEMVQKFREEWAQLAPPGTDKTGLADGRPVLSVVTLASLVERETPKPDERPLVAGVFENRLRKKMLLQCDPTVIYALQQAGGYDGELNSKDLHFDSPYNTYEHRGLPPGPIGNPGEASLRAALEPAQTGYLYFVANTEGGHFFSDTLEEHNKNVVRYHRLLAGLPADPPPPPRRVARKRPPVKRHHKGLGR